MGNKKLIFLIFLLASLSIHSQSIKDRFISDIRYGFALNSSIKRNIEPVGLTPSLVLFFNQNQLELGAIFHPKSIYDPTLLGAELNYKYYFNDIDEVYNIYFITTLSLYNLSSEVDVFNTQSRIFQAEQHIFNDTHLMLLPGAGGEIKISEYGYIGANLNIGAATKRRRVEVGGNSRSLEHGFFEFNSLSYGLSINVGCRF